MNEMNEWMDGWMKECISKAPHNTNVQASCFMARLVAAGALKAEPAAAAAAAAEDEDDGGRL